MLKKLVFSLCIAAVIFGCDQKEKEQLQTKLDSLQTELEISQRMAKTLTEVGVLMDSIDATRQLLRVNMVEGTSYEDYKERMRDINSYVKDTQRKIDDLEKTLSKSRSTSNAYAATIKKLKADMEEKTKRISDLQEQVEKFRNENQNIITTVGMQKTELLDKEAEIETKTQELALI